MDANKRIADESAPPPYAKNEKETIIEKTKAESVSSSEASSSDQTAISRNGGAFNADNSSDEDVAEKGAAVVASVKADDTAAAATTPTEERNPNIVDWDSPDDPANPRNWTKAFKMTNILLVSFAVLYTNLATTLFAPAAPVMQKEFGYKSDTIEVLTITAASLGFAVGQLFVPPLSEVFGRQPIYRISSILYLIFTAGCVRSRDVAAFIVCRVLTGVAASAYVSTGGGTIADLLPKEERGLAMAIYTSAPLLGPVIGPIVGGVITQRLNWQWTFYLILILSFTVTIVSFIVMRETSAVTILKAKAARLRKETGNPNLIAAGDKQIPLHLLVAGAVVRPIKFLVMSPVLLLVALYIAVNFGITMLLFATFPTVYEDTYHWSVGISGLAYVGVGVGCAIGVFIFAKFADRLVRVPEGKEYKPERRMILMMYVSPLFPIAMFIYAWTTEYKVHWIAPIIGTTLGGPAVVVITSASQTYIIDIFGPQGAASAFGGINLLRNLLGAFLPMAAPPLYEKLGLGWGNSALAFLLVLFIPVPFLFFFYGQSLRQRFPVKI